MPRGIYKRTEEQKKRMSESHKGKIGYWNNKKFPPRSKEWKDKVVKNLRSDYWLGKKRPNISGKNHYLYNPNLSTARRLRYCLKYRQWRCDIFERDNYTCQICGIRGGRLEADHIKAFSLILLENNITTYGEGLTCEELWNLNNGRTLCEDCHRETDNYLLKARWNIKKK